jgi:23S rRNA U2552 (ribose-2'-O)-methylase RlmE/FtsJ
MSYYLLSSIKSKININNINITFGNNDIIISKSLNNYINLMKQQIDNYMANWDIYKKYTNPYEYIHSNIPDTKVSICKYKPISRSFYKMIEICNVLHVLDNLKNDIKTFHLAEGPGGFIEAIDMLRNNKNDFYYGMTLIDDNSDYVPGWNKSDALLKKNSNIIIEKGQDGTGNLFNYNNLLHCYNKYKSSMDIITGDGGFDFSIDFCNQEIIASKLIFTQMIYAIILQKKGGTFILKIFDIFTQATIDILYILSIFYNKVYIIKPNTSRYANSERYIVCKFFKGGIDESFLKNLSYIFQQLNTEKNICRFLNIEVPYILTNKIEEINAIIGQQQLENILLTLNILDNNKSDKLEFLKKNNIQKCIQWCSKNKLAYIKNLHSLNIFLTNNP